MGPAVGNDRQRAIINTIMSLSACTCSTFAMSSLLSKDNKFDMVHVQNAAIAGGVTGLCMSWTAFDRMEEAELYEDEIFWECESEEKADDEKNELQTMA